MKHENLINRPDGSQIKIVAELFEGCGMHLTIGNYVLHRASPDDQWSLAGDRPRKKQWDGVQDYIESGRPEMLCLATPGEILKTNAGLIAKLHPALRVTPA